MYDVEACARCGNDTRRRCPECTNPVCAGCAGYPHERGKIMSTTTPPPAMRADGSIPDVDERSAPVVALDVQIYQDVDGYKWLAFGTDEFYCLDDQLVRAIRSKIPSRGQAGAMAVGGDLQPLAVVVDDSPVLPQRGERGQR